MVGVGTSIVDPHRIGIRQTGVPFRQIESLQCHTGADGRFAVDAAGRLQRAFALAPFLDRRGNRHGVAGPQKTVSISDLLSIQGVPDRKLQWAYHANKLTDGSLSAEMDQSLVTLIEDPNALVHHFAAKELNRDDIYTAKQTDPGKPPLLPAKGLPLTMTLTFPKVEK